MRKLTIQDKAADAVYALNAKDAELVLGIIDRILEDYDLPELTPDEEAELTRLEAEDKEPGVPLEAVLAEYGISVE